MPQFYIGIITTTIITRTVVIIGYKQYTTNLIHLGIMGCTL